MNYRVHEASHYLTAWLVMLRVQVPGKEDEDSVYPGLSAIGACLCNKSFLKNSLYIVCNKTSPYLVS